MSTPTMKTLVIQPTDLGLRPLGSDASGASAQVSVVYDRDVWVAGQPIPRVPLIQTSLPAGGLSVSVLANDDPSITQGAGFAIEVVIETASRLGRHGGEGGPRIARTIQITSKDAALVPLGSKPNLTPVADPALMVDVMAAIEATASAKRAAEAAKAAATQATSRAAATSSLAGVAPLTAGVRSGATSIVCVGDSNTECVGSTSRAGTWPDRVASRLRTDLDISGDTGVGFVSACSWWGPALPASGAKVVSGAGGLDGRAVQLDSGATLTWPSAQATSVTVVWTSTVWATGKADVLVDGAKAGVIDASGGQTTAGGQRVKLTVPAGAHTVAITTTSGTVQVEGVIFQTATSGLTLYQAGRSGSKAMDWAADAYWAQSLPSDARLVIIGLGGNDQGGNWGTPISGADFGASLVAMVRQVRSRLPGAGVVVMVGAPRLDDIQAGKTAAFNASFVQGAIDALAEVPMVTVLAESDLWSPRAIDPVDPLGWLRSGDRIHRSDAGNDLVAQWLTEKLEVAPGRKGARGAPGPAAALTVGKVTTGDPGSQAAASVTGTAPNQVLNLTVPTGPAGTPTAYELRGTGMPEGVVTASPGTYYTDTAGTNGAWRWLKTSGTGSTGWRPDGVSDTGWRFLTPLNGWAWSVPLAIRRVGAMIYVQGRLNGANATANAFATIPAGFGFYSGSFTIPALAGGTLVLRAGASGSQSMETASRPSSIDLMASWASLDPWPTTLP